VIVRTLADGLTALDSADDTIETLTDDEIEQITDADVEPNDAPLCDECGLPMDEVDSGVDLEIGAGWTDYECLNCTSKSTIEKHDLDADGAALHEKDRVYLLRDTGFYPYLQRGSIGTVWDKFGFHGVVFDGVLGIHTQARDDNGQVFPILNICAPLGQPDAAPTPLTDEQINALRKFRHGLTSNESKAVCDIDTFTKLCDRKVIGWRADGGNRPCWQITNAGIAALTDAGEINADGEWFDDYAGVPLFTKHADGTWELINPVQALPFEMDEEVAELFEALETMYDDGLITFDQREDGEITVSLTEVGMSAPMIEEGDHATR